MSENGQIFPQYEQFISADLLARPEKPLHGKSALITGATRFNGLGFAIAERFALEGVSPIIIVGTENSRDIAPYAESRLKRYGVDTYSLVGDISSRQSAREMMEKAYELCDGDLNILVNNAGVNVNHELTEVSDEDWEKVMGAKARGALNMSSEWFRIRNENSVRGGRVITIGSIVGLYGNHGQAVYEMANAALGALTSGMAVELGRFGITANLIAPGFITGTDMTAGMTEKELSSIKASNPLGTLITPQEIAGLAAFIAGPDARNISGSVIAVDSGGKSNYTALQSLDRAGFKQMPKFALGLFGRNAETGEEMTLTRGDITAVNAYRAKQRSQGGNI